MPVLIVVASCLLLLAACADDSADGVVGNAAGSSSSQTDTAQHIDLSEQDEVQWLYVIDADAAVATDSSLTLAGLDPDAVAFTDRPTRQARRLLVQELVDDWNAMGFVDDPPNAALAVRLEGEQQVYVVELTEPQLDADELTFSYVLIDEPGTPLPANLGPLAVFIDDGHDGTPVLSPGFLDDED
jgi:hypothetical protein